MWPELSGSETASVDHCIPISAFERAQISIAVAMYPQGYFIAKRGEQRPADKPADQTVEIVELARTLAAWHFRMPIIAGNENRLFGIARTVYAPLKSALRLNA